MGKLAVVVTMKDCLDGELSKTAHQGKVLASPKIICIASVFWYFGGLMSDGKICPLCGGFFGGLKNCGGCPNFAKEELLSLNHFHFHPDMIQRKPMLSLRKGKYSLPDHFSISNAETARCNIY